MAPVIFVGGAERLLQASLNNGRPAYALANETIQAEFYLWQPMQAMEQFAARYDVSEDHADSDAAHHRL
jgi:hypothetical protein